MKFTKENLKEMRTEFAKAVSDMEKKYDITISMGNISFDQLQFQTKLTVSSNVKFSEEGERLEFEKYCEQYRLEKSHYGHVLNIRGSKYTIIGFELSRPKYCIKVKNEKNEIVLLTESSIRDIQKPWGHTILEVNTQCYPID